MIITIFHTLFSFLIVAISGRVFMSFVNTDNKSSSFNLFLELFAGFYGLVMLFAIVKTGLITVSSLFVLWVLLWLFITKKFKLANLKDFFKANSNSNFKIELIIILLLFTIVSYFQYSVSSSGVPIVINRDALSDVTRAIFLNYTGIENSNTNFIQLPTGSQPYHYFEAWSVAFFSTITDSNYWLSQSLVFKPIILTIVYCGFRVLTSEKAGNYLSVFFALSLFLASGLVNDDILKIHFFKWVVALKTNIIDEPWWTRLSVLYPPIILSIYFVKHKKLTHAIFSILLIPFLSVTPAIPIIISVTIILCLSIIFSKSEKRKLAQLLVLPILCAAMYKGFYSIYMDESEFISLPKTQQIMLELSDMNLLKSKFIMIIEKIIQTSILYSPYLIIISFVFITRKYSGNIIKWPLNHKVIFLFTILLAFISLLMWQILYFIFGASFFYHYTFVPVLNIVLIYGTYKVVNLLNTSFKTLSIICLIILNIYFVNRSVLDYNKSVRNYWTEKYHPDYLLQVKKVYDNKIALKDLALGVKLEDHSEIVHPFFNDGLSFCGYYMYGIANAPALISLSRADIPEYILKESRHYETFTKHSSFYKYVHNKTNKETNVNLLKKQFIEEFNIRFGVVSAFGNIPEELKCIIDEVIIDKRSGERFIVFNTK